MCVDIMNRLLSQFGSGDGGAPPASERGLQQLSTVVIDEHGIILHTALTVSGVHGEIIGKHASFLSPPPEEGTSAPLTGRLVVANPFTCHTDDVSNRDAIKGSVALVSRGINSFANKIQRCEAMGAICVIIIQNVGMLLFCNCFFNYTAS